MPRTRQTARKSTGGRAPRRQLATRAGYFGASDDTSQSTLVEIYNTTRTRTIAVDGQDEFEVPPDLVNLSFDISEEAVDYQEAIQLTLASLDACRNKALAMGIPNESMSCDSMSVSERVKIMQDGVEVEDDGEEEEEEDDDFARPVSSKSRKRAGQSVGGPPAKKAAVEEGEGEVPKKIKEKIRVTVYIPRIILRMRLEEDTLKLFGRLMFTVLQMGVPNFEAPMYETTELTAHRHKARDNAIINAKDKATIILDGIDDSSLCLGDPITVNDIHCDVQDDSLQSFTGSHTPWFLSYGKKKSSHTGDIAPISDSLLARMDDLFVIPPLRIIARIKVIFEITKSAEEKQKTEEEDIPDCEAKSVTPAD